MYNEQNFAGGGIVAFDEGGDVGMNLDALPTLNVNTGMQSDGGSMGGGALYSFNDNAAMSPIAKMLPSTNESIRSCKILGFRYGGFFWNARKT
jgi:hypothetical protein